MSEKNVIPKPDLENECLWCDRPCAKDFCSNQCALHWVKE